MIKDILDNNIEMQSNTKQLDVLHKYFPGCFSAEGVFDI